MWWAAGYWAPHGQALWYWWEPWLSAGYSAIWVAGCAATRPNLLRRLHIAASSAYDVLSVTTRDDVEPMTGIEPAYSAWEVDSLRQCVSGCGRNSSVTCAKRSSAFAGVR